MSYNRIMAATLVAAALFTSTPIWAAAADYRFELDGQPTKSGMAMVIKIRLVHVPDGKSVSGALIVQTKFDMGPDGMADMGVPAKALPGSEGGVYEIQAEPSVAGNWALTLTAKVQGEPETVQGTVTVPVAK